MDCIHSIHWTSLAPGLPFPGHGGKNMSQDRVNDSRKRLKLGTNGPDVFPLGLGAMGMSGMYGASDEAESLATLRQAIERGVTLIDTGDFYGMGHNELLVGRAIAGQRDRVLVSVKFGAMRGPDGSFL